MAQGLIRRADVDLVRERSRLDEVVSEHVTLRTRVAAVVAYAHSDDPAVVPPGSVFLDVVPGELSAADAAQIGAALTAAAALVEGDAR